MPVLSATPAYQNWQTPAANNGKLLNATTWQSGDFARIDLHVETGSGAPGFAVEFPMLLSGFLHRIEVKNGSAAPTQAYTLTLKDAAEHATTISVPAAGMSDTARDDLLIGQYTLELDDTGSASDFVQIALFFSAHQLNLESDKQPLDAGLTSLAALASTGIVCATAADAYTLRTIANGTGVQWTNPGGVAGNPTASLIRGRIMLTGWSIGTVIGTDSTYNTTMYSYADTAQASRLMAGMVPDNYDVSGDLSLRILYYADADISGLVLRLTHQATRGRVAAALSAGSVIASTTTDYTIPAGTTAGMVRELTIATIAGGTLAVGDHLTVQLQREGNHANDTLATAWRILYPVYLLPV